jgi:hypothetical protein
MVPASMVWRGVAWQAWIGRRCDIMERLADLLERVERSLPPDVLRELRQEGFSLTLGSSLNTGYTFASASTVVRLDPALAEEEIAELEAMASFGPNTTGIDNTIFISPDATGRHAARIKVAIDPPLTFSVRAKTASISIHDGEHVAGEAVPAALLRQLRQFIELNRDVLMDYWRQDIDTAELQRRLRKI